MNRARTAKNIAYTGLMAGSLTAVKFALAWLANVELVTLLLVFYTIKLGKSKTFLACNVFIVVECLLFGVGAWLISYFLHWNALILVIWLFSRKKIRNSPRYALIALGMTFLFGVNTTFFEVILYSSSTDLLSAFALKYFMGITFFAVHISSAFLSVLFLLPALLKIPVEEKLES